MHFLNFWTVFTTYGAIRWRTAQDPRKAARKAARECAGLLIFPIGRPHSLSNHNGS